MTKFIKLTEAFQNDNTIHILLNVECIKSINLSNKGINTHVYMTDAKYYFMPIRLSPTDTKSRSV